MKPWLIVSPEYGVMEPILDDGSGPMEYVSDVVFVEAETKRDAIQCGVRLFYAQGARYLDETAGEHPFAGVQAILQLCPAHGLAVWRHDHYECSECEALFGVES